MNKEMVTIAKYTVLEVFHNRLFLLVLLSALTSIGIGMFGYTLAITESVEIQAAFTSSSLRIFSIFIVTLVVINTLFRELNDKSIDMLLSLAIKRSTYYFGKLLGFTVVIFFISVIFGICLLLTSSVEQVIIWTISLFLELFLILCFSFLCAISLQQISMAVIVVLGFYVLSRSINSAVLMINSPIFNVDTVANTLMIYILQGIAFLLPDLSLFTKSEWLIYTVDWAIMPELLLQTFIYFILIAAASLIDFYRKNI